MDGHMAGGDVAGDDGGNFAWLALDGVMWVKAVTTADDVAHVDIGDCTL